MQRPITYYQSQANMNDILNYIVVNYIFNNNNSSSI